MSLKAKIEAVIYASEEPVTAQQLVSLLGGETQAAMDAADERQGQLALLDAAEPGAEREAESGTAAETRARDRRLREYIRSVLDTLVAEYRDGDRGLEIREIAGGFRFATKPEYHDAVRGFVRSLKPPLKLSLQALETLAVVAYKQPVTAPEVSEIRGVDSGGVLGSLMTRKLVTTAGRKQVIGRPILYKTTKDFLLRFGLKDVAELPSIEEFERLASSLHEAEGEEIAMPETPVVPVAAAATMQPLRTEEVAREVEGSRDIHAAQADGDPNASIPTADEVDDKRLTPAPDGPGEFTGDETVAPAENTVTDGRLSGVPPTYDDRTDEMLDSPANDAAVQSE